MMRVSAHAVVCISLPKGVGFLATYIRPGIPTPFQHAMDSSTTRHHDGLNRLDTCLEVPAAWRGTQVGENTAGVSQTYDARFRTGPSREPRSLLLEPPPQTSISCD
eukprot:272417-Prorocentrum_minimum.AAC.1